MTRTAGLSVLVPSHDFPHPGDSVVVSSNGRRGNIGRRRPSDLSSAIELWGPIACVSDIGVKSCLALSGVVKMVEVIEAPWRWRPERGNRRLDRYASGACKAFNVGLSEVAPCAISLVQVIALERMIKRVRIGTEGLTKGRLMFALRGLATFGLEAVHR